MTLGGPTPATPDRPTTVVDLLRLRAVREPHARAYTFLVNGEDDEQHLTIGELDRRAQAIAAGLVAAGAAGHPVLLVFSSGLGFVEAFFGCLYAGAIAVAVSPPRPRRSWHRFDAIARDSGARVALTQETLRPRIEPLVKDMKCADGLTWIAADEVDAAPATAWVSPTIDADSLALLQYTSGSTASPRGTMVTHGNILRNSHVICEAFAHTPRTVGVGWLPLTHDMGLIGNILQPLYAGFPYVFMAPEHFLVRPVRWLEAISRYHGTTSGGPNFAYDLCVDRVTAEQRRSLDLSSWTLAFNGAEPVRPETIESFSTTFAAHGFRPEAFYPCYGLAEATLFVTGGPAASPPIERRLDTEALKTGQAVVATDPRRSRTLVGCGRPIPPDAVAIVAPATRSLVADGQVGEIWVRGPTVTRGYWNQPATTAETFQGFLKDAGAGPYLRTGDLGFRYEGMLFVTGRLRDLIIVGGMNHFPVDI